MNYPIYTPDIERYTHSAISALKSGWVSSQGEFIEKSCSKLREIIGTPYAVMMNNGTSATHMLYKALKFKHPEITKVYLPNYVFAAVWNCALYEYTREQLELLETDPTTLNMREDEPYLATLAPNSAVVIVHNVGNVINVPRLKRLRPDLVFVEDCCEAFLESYEGRKTGTDSLCAAVSFFANKLITSGEGGVFYTADKELYDFIYKSCHHGMTSERYIYDVLGYNYRMTNIQAALLYDQLVDIDAIVTRKREVYERYARLFGDATATRGIWMFLARLPGVTHAALRARGIDSRPMFYPASRQSHLSLTGAESPIGHTDLIMLPSSPSLTTYDQVWIANAVKQIQHKVRLDIVRATPALLTEFCSNPMPPTFRYFSKRSIDVCETHTVTIIGIVDGKPVAYAHIDDRWIGLCVLPQHQNRGYGRTLLSFVCDYGTAEKIPLRLTVDADNLRAKQMYEKMGFVCVSRSTQLVMERSI